VATRPLYLNALTGRGVHLSTVNDYLARRDPYWMGPIYSALGMTVACIYPQTPDEQSPARLYDPAYDSGRENDRWRHFKPVARKEAYHADILYGTSAEFGFDYLRDNMVMDLAQQVQRPLNFAIVDEVDYLLIDEARTPLIISGQADSKEDIYATVEKAISRLSFKVLPHEASNPQEKEEEAALEGQYDYLAYDKTHNIRETPRGLEKMARAYGMKVEDFYSSETGDKNDLPYEEIKRRNALLHISRQSMLAHTFYQRDKEYVIDNDQDGKPGIIIIDEFTGRKMFGRRYSDGLHQAIEAKEHLRVRQESRTYATVTIQNYFRMYDKLAGMTGTAETEAEEFHKIYKLEVVAIPPNRPNQREDFLDQIYKNEAGKFRAVVKEVREKHQEGRPVLVGTVSIEASERLSDMMKRQGIAHSTLNAKQHEKEGLIIADAGRQGAVTIATNMAGRGVDIILGGSPEERDPKEWQEAHDRVVALGGLHVVGTEHHEARRIDNQLRGRSGRQGDPGSSRFFVSLEDDVVRRFGGDRIRGIMEWAGMDEETPIENKIISRAIENSQVRVEGFNFDIRKHLVEYDDVVNKQREVIYTERRKILGGADLKSNIQNMVDEHLKEMVTRHAASEDGHVDAEGLLREVGTVMPLPPDATPEALAAMKPDEIAERLDTLARAYYEAREKEYGPELMRQIERLVMLRTIDTLWVDHLTAMENMREGIGLEAVAQHDPLVAYKTRGHEQFARLLEDIKHDVARTIFKVRVEKKQTPPVSTPMAKAAVNRNAPTKTTPRVAGQKVGRNDLCPCGSGKKYKHCCGK